MLQAPITSQNMQDPSTHEGYKVIHTGLQQLQQLQQLKKFSLTLRNTAVALLRQNSAFLPLMSSLTHCKVLRENFSLQRWMIGSAGADLIMHEYWAYLRRKRALTLRFTWTNATRTAWIHRLLFGRELTEQSGKDMTLFRGHLLWDARTTRTQKASLEPWELK